jgi:hypothetical protein
VAISRAKKLLVIVGDSKTVIGGAPELFGPLFEHCRDEGLVAGVGAVVTACQRVGIRSQVQRLSKPKRGERRRNRRKRRQRELAAAVGMVANGQEPAEGVAESAPAASEVPEEPERPQEPVLPEGAEEPMVREAVDAPRPRRRRTTRVPAQSELTPTEGTPNGTAEQELIGAEAAQPHARRAARRSPARELEVASVDPSAPDRADGEDTKPRRRRTARNAEPEQAELPLDVGRPETEQT